MLELLDVKHIFVMKYDLMGFFSKKKNTEAPKGHVDLLSGFQGVPLRSYLKVYLGREVRNQPMGKLIKVSDLSGDWINYELKIEKLETVQLYSPHIKQLNESCLLISNRGANLIVSYFSFTGEPIFCSPHIHCFTVTKNNIDVGYLIYKLLKTKEVSDQVKVLLGNDFYGRMQAEDVLDFRISSSADLENKGKAQKAYAETIRADYKGFFTESYSNVIDLKESSSREIDSLRHTASQYLSALLSSVQGLKKFMEREEGKEISLKLFYSEKEKITLESHLNSTENLISSITDLLVNSSSKGAKSVSMDLIDSIRKAQLMHSNGCFYFNELIIDRSTFGKQASVSEIRVLFDWGDFIKLFSNVVSNAVDHGFKGRMENNMIRSKVYFDIESNMCVLEISNNGNPLAEDFDFKRLVTWGEKTSDSSGKGIGGSDILKVMENHEGKFEVVSNQTDEFPVTYKLSFKIYIDEI
jgi:type I restriction enzyme M protein